MVELHFPQSKESPLNRSGVGRQDDRVLGRLRGKMERLRRVGDDPLRQILALDRAGDVDPVVADLADVETVELGLRELDHDPVQGSGPVLAVLDVEAEDPLRSPAPGALEGLLAGQVVPALGEAPLPVVEARGSELAGRAAEGHRGALVQHQ
jgi:hypothetical protein